MNTVILIAYRPDHTDVCQGCNMGSAASDMAHGVFNNLEDAADFMAYYMKENEVRDMYSFAEYEFTSIINGIDYNNGEGDSYDFASAAELEGLARKRADVLIEEYHEAEAERIIKAKVNRIKEEKERELATLNRLKEKYRES